MILETRLCPLPPSPPRTHWIVLAELLQPPTVLIIILCATNLYCVSCDFPFLLLCIRYNVYMVWSFHINDGTVPMIDAAGEADRV